eukprot:CAMPEP_0119132130 /NCGR_PEP_ID=MMETSP1310-20130426/11574_1 /TAXON_ID=464262 /ORGANISM="Genus nov. species nov., Strain RCC2339" /LENGTH=105 /DNA_ID=CAMNT_0007122747 /DNA_START=151 /DNA_END=465 /DNA_ORIENTATION=-
MARMRDFMASTLCLCASTIASVTRWDTPSAPVAKAASVMSQYRGSWLPDTTTFTVSSAEYPSNSAAASSFCTSTAFSLTRLWALRTLSIRPPMLSNSPPLPAPAE